MTITIVTTNGIIDTGKVKAVKAAASKPDDGVEYGGIEYAIQRISDGAFLFDADGDGTDVSWEDDEENCTWMDTPEHAIALAELNDLAAEIDDGTVLDEGFVIIARPWRYEEDIEADEDAEEAWS